MNPTPAPQLPGPETVSTRSPLWLDAVESQANGTFPNRIHDDYFPSNVSRARWQLTDSDCIMCRGADADNELDRIEVWQDALWWLTVSLSSEVSGFAYLEPKRHVRYIHELDGDEAATFGSVLAKCTKALKEATDAKVVFAYVFGDGVPHLHVHLAPHHFGDALNDQMIRGEIVEEKLPNGMTRFYSVVFPPLPRDSLKETADQVRGLLLRD